MNDDAPASAEHTAANRQLPWKPLLPIPRSLYQFSGEAFATPDPEAWCHGEAARLLGPKARRKDITRLGACLAGHLGVLRPKMPLLAAGLFFSPGFRKLPAGVTTWVEAFDIAPVNGGRQFTRTDAAEAAAEARDAPPAPGERPFGRTEAVDCDLPSGPALRVHRYVKAETLKQEIPAGEVIVWTIWPPGPPIAVMMTTMWLEPYYGQVAAEIADGMARDFRTTTTDSGSENA
jgi:hypothetical protein